MNKIRRLIGFVVLLLMVACAQNEPSAPNENHGLNHQSSAEHQEDIQAGGTLQKIREEIIDKGEEIRFDSLKIEGVFIKFNNSVTVTKHHHESNELASKYMIPPEFKSPSRAFRVGSDVYVLSVYGYISSNKLDKTKAEFEKQLSSAGIEFEVLW